MPEIKNAVLQLIVIRSEIVVLKNNSVANSDFERAITLRKIEKNLVAIIDELSEVKESKKNWLQRLLCK